VDEVVAALATTPDGLSGAEAVRRLRAHGPNTLRRVTPPSAWRLLIDQFRSTVVALLVIAAVVAAALGETADALAIAAVLLVNAGLGFATEWRARGAMEALRRMDVRRAGVLRDGHLNDVDAQTVVPGDVLVLEPGDSIPADARLLAGAELQVVEAPLTGESVPVPKSSAPVPEPTLMADRACMLHKGTVVACGHARAVVVATGVRTEIGRIGALVAATDDEEPPLERRMEQLGRRLIGIVVVVAVVVAALGILRGQPAMLMLQTSIALAIAAVPEGLPAVVTITLAVGMARMARRRALVRRLSAVETLGSTTVVCTDKTGTITSGEMTARRLWVAGEDVEISGTGYGPEGALHAAGAVLRAAEDALRAGLLANRADVVSCPTGWAAAGDPTEAALLVAAGKAGLRRGDLLAEACECGEVPFSSARMLMATFHREDGRVVAYVKGAPERVVERCATWRDAPGPRPLDAAARERVAAANSRLAGDGLRVLALARVEVAAGDPLDAEALHGLTLLGLVGLQDPAAEGVPETVAALRRAGVRTLMLTGDQRLTGEAVAREVGILEDGALYLDGGELADLDDAALRHDVGRIGAVSRVTPEQKLRVIQALRDRGEIVAMLGDGVNDAPALKRADIGVAMGGRGTDVAREAAHLVLQDDRLVTVAAAVEEGRVLFDDIRKFVYYLFSCNLSEVLVLLLGALAGLPLPLLPLQILWLNLVTDVFPALALAMEPGEPDVMDRSPRDPRAAVLSRRFLASILAHGLLLTVCVLAAFVWALQGGDVPRATTVVFMSIALAQLLHVVNARSDRPVLFTRRLVSNRWVLGAGVLVVALQAAALYVPDLAALLGNVPLDGAAWVAVAVAGTVPLLGGQAWRWWSCRGMNAAPSA
jgi:Ca2+-transporting ATPase